MERAYGQATGRHNHEVDGVRVVRPSHETVRSAVTLLLAASLVMLSQPAHAMFGPMAIAIDEKAGKVYVAGDRGSLVLVLGLDSLRLLDSRPLETKPTGISPGPDGSLLVSVAGSKSWIQLWDPKSGRLYWRSELLPGGCAPLFSSHNSSFYVCNRFANSVSRLAWPGRSTHTQPATREPVALALSPSATVLAVANLLPAGRADVAVTSALVDFFDARTLERLKSVALPNGSTSVRAVAFHPASNLCAVVHGVGRFQVPTTQVEHGWMNVSVLTLISLSDFARTSFLLDRPRRGAANPSSVAWSKDARFLCIAHEGTHEASVIDFEQLAASAAPTGHSDASTLRWLGPERRIVALPGKGPRALAVTGQMALVAEYFSDSIAVVDLERATVIKSVALPSGQTETMPETGERIFHDASIGHQGWQSCATCHPDARMDGFNWDLLNDGIGNPKNTKSLLLSHATPPAMSLGARSGAEEAVRSGFRHIMFAPRTEEETLAVDAYLKSLKPVPSPFLVSGKLSSAARRGREVFRRAGCAVCHPPGLFTDLKAYDVGTGGPNDRAKTLFDTPTLVELWRTAPYLHDGSAATVREVITERNPDDRHGTTAFLSPGEVEDLCAYLMSL